MFILTLLAVFVVPVHNPPLPEDLQLAMGQALTPLLLALQPLKTASTVIVLPDAISLANRSFTVLSTGVSVGGGHPAGDTAFAVQTVDAGAVAKSWIVVSFVVVLPK